ncbi:MAG: hypothetical protein OER92_06705 [Alphaproteobacteria bacterium]|nr:hypothetical protein [Alphaproteobacteria bacterium]
MNASKIDQAFPLVRELKDNLTLDDWRDYAAGYLGPATIKRGHRGIIAAEHRDCIRGLLCYDVLTDLVDLTTLAVRDVIVLGVPAGQPAARSLLQQLFAIAGAHRCGAIRVDLSEPMRWLAREWSDPEGELFRFPVICFLPGSTVPAPPGAMWPTQGHDPTANPS